MHVTEYLLVPVTREEVRRVEELALRLHAYAVDHTGADGLLLNFRQQPKGVSCLL